MTNPLLYHFCASGALAAAVIIFLTWKNRTFIKYPSKYTLGFYFLTFTGAAIFSGLIGILFCSLASAILFYLLVKLFLHFMEIRSVNKVSVFYAVPSPTTSFHRRVQEGRWQEHRDPLVFYITEDEWKSNPALNDVSRKWFEQFKVAPCLYVAPSENDVLQVVDSLALFSYLLSGLNGKAVARFRDLLNNESVPKPQNPVVEEKAEEKSQESAPLSDGHQESLAPDPSHLENMTTGKSIKGKSFTAFGPKNKETTD